MIYRCIEHYNVSNDNITNIDISSCEREKQNECFICLDVNVNSALFRLNELCIEYYKKCNCAGFVHRKCVNSWFIMSSNKCPICRNNMKKIVPVHIVIIEKCKYIIFTCGNKGYCFCNVFLQYLLLVTHNMAYLILYFIGFLHFIKLIAICFMVFSSIINEIENKTKHKLQNDSLLAAYNNYYYENYNHLQILESLEINELDICVRNEEEN
jgi:hypothetical protein